jgi:hypothetical protein
VKIPFSNYEMVLHRPGEVANHSERRLSEPDRITDKLLDVLPVKVRSTGEKATAQRIRSQFIAIADKTMSSVLFGKTEGVMRMQTAGDASWAGKNEKVANEALKMVRLALYNKKYGSYKSDNKRKLTDADAENKRLADGTFAKWPKVESTYISPHAAAMIARNNWRSTMINCDGLAFAAMDYVTHKHPNVPVFAIGLSGRHQGSRIKTR